MPLAFRLLMSNTISLCIHVGRRHLWQGMIYTSLEYFQGACLVTLVYKNLEFLGQAYAGTSGVLWIKFQFLS